MVDGAPATEGRPTPAALLADLGAEQADLDDLLEDLPAAEWRRPTPVTDWTVRDQVAHLLFFDEALRLAVTNPVAFVAERARAHLLGDTYRVAALRRDLGLEHVSLLHRWRSAREALAASLARADPSVRVPWYGPDLALTSTITARLMETWAHGQDIADAVGWQRHPADRLRHVAHLGVASRAFSFRNHGLTDPDDPIYVGVHGPSGTVWHWGPEDAPNTVRGSALDLCLVVTRRRHLDDVRLEVRGSVARRWLLVAQAYAGPPGAGRRAGQFAAPVEAASS